MDRVVENRVRPPHNGRYESESQTGTRGTTRGHSGEAPRRQARSWGEIKSCGT